MPRINEIDNPVYLFVQKTFIPMLTLAETTEMISRLGYFMGLDFDPSVIAHIHNRFGGHPFFTRQLCSQIHRLSTKTRPHVVSILACKAAEEASRGDIQKYLDDILGALKSLYPEEYEMVVYLAKGNMDYFNELGEYNPAVVEHLIGYGLLIKRADDYEFGFDLIQEVAKRRSENTKDLSLPDKWSEISKRRNLVEGSIRSALYYWAMTLDPNQWHSVWTECITTKRQTELGMLSWQEAFSQSNSLLYLIELLTFIVKTGQYGAVQTAVGSVPDAINVVNSFRADAHAKGIDDMEFKKVMAALDSLETIFVAPM